MNLERNRNIKRATHLGPDDKSTQVSARGELQKVQAVDVASVDTGQVTEGLDNTVVLLVDDERAYTTEAQ